MNIDNLVLAITLFSKLYYTQICRENQKYILVTIFNYLQVNDFLILNFFVLWIQYNTNIDTLYCIPANYICTSWFDCST
jgi:hypothetical protein